MVTGIFFDMMNVETKNNNEHLMKDLKLNNCVQQKYINNVHTQQIAV